MHNLVNLARITISRRVILLWDFALWDFAGYIRMRGPKVGFCVPKKGVLQVGKLDLADQKMGILNKFLISLSFSFLQTIQ